MGSRVSRQETPRSQAPRGFYVVEGSPHIRYRYDKVYGPLIYHAETESTVAEQLVERADSFQMTAAVGSKQPFLLVPRAAGPSKSADLSFDIYMTKPIKKLSVLANTAVSYVVNKGVVLRPIPEQPHQPVCVYEAHVLDVAQSHITTTAPIFYTALVAATFSTTITAAARDHDGDDDGETEEADAHHVTRAPLVIVLELPEVDVEALPGKKSNDGQGKQSSTNELGAVVDSRKGEEAAPVRSDGSQRRGNAAGLTATPSPPPPQLARVLQFTFLDFDRTAGPAVHSGGDSATASAASPIRLRVVKQLLQLGAEVYELDDVFDLGNAFQPNAAGTEDAGDEGASATSSTGYMDQDDPEEENLCVVCLSTPKDTAILPCRHMCVCHECAAQLRLNNNKCPICRGTIDRVLTM